MAWQRSPWWWFSPLLAILALAIVYPWMWSFTLSFREWNLESFTAGDFVGIRHYIDTLTDPTFHRAFMNSLVFTLSTVFLQFLIGLSLALLAQDEFPLRRIFVVALSIPFMLTPTMVGLLWKLLLHSQWGALNYFLEWAAGVHIGWLHRPEAALGTIILIDVWQHVSWVFLVLWAGMQAIPPDLYEAGELDGATSCQSFRYITVPYLLPVIVTVILFRTIFAFRAFDVIFTLFRSGGPDNAAMVLGVYLYERFRLTFDLGLTSAVSYIILASTVLLTGLFLVRLYREEVAA